VADKKAEIKQAQRKDELLQSEAKKLDARFRESKAALDRDYARMLEEPELDIKSTQSKYQEAWANVKQNQQQRLTNEQESQDLSVELSRLEAAQRQLLASLDTLQNQKLRARADRLRAELSTSHTNKVSFTNTCAANMTLAQCSKQTETLALQKAVGQFRNEILSATTESKLVKRNTNAAPLNIHVVSHKVSVAKFYNENKHQSVLDVELESRPATNTPCKLLDIPSSHCFAPGEVSAESQQQEVPWVTLTVRSNQFSDRVLIDGVRYGSTPVDIMLPVGTHRVIVEKEGYRSFNQELKIENDHTLRAVLREEQNLPQSGRLFADKMRDGLNAPQMVVVGKGEYLIGKNGAEQVNLDTPFAIGATPVTVAEFSKFVESTGYQTDAELKKICLAVTRSSVEPIADTYWRNPGFKQGASSPATCISYADAVAYTKWLTNETSYQYRLPTEAEWEIAARAGSKSAYPWGEQFGTGNANTGWSGTTWANVSTSPVKSFAPNALGLYDVVGNVWEWTNDSRGLAKGGAWSFSPIKAATDEKLFVDTNSAANYVGFRVIRAIK
jgi:formylglycine-generating enzyme required for sulfatase activity